MFCQTFLSPQVKRCAIFTYKHGIHELLHELPKDLRLRKLVSLKYFATGCLWKPLFDINLPHTPLNLISLAISVALGTFALL